MNNSSKNSNFLLVSYFQMEIFKLSLYLDETGFTKDSITISQNL